MEASVAVSAKLGVATKRYLTSDQELDSPRLLATDAGQRSSSAGPPRGYVQFVSFEQVVNLSRPATRRSRNMMEQVSHLCSGQDDAGGVGDL